jgi:hypothetical protein
MPPDDANTIAMTEKQKAINDCIKLFKKNPEAAMVALKLMGCELEEFKLNGNSPVVLKNECLHIQIGSGAVPNCFDEKCFILDADHTWVIINNPVSKVLRKLYPKLLIGIKK